MSASAGAVSVLSVLSVHGVPMLMRCIGSAAPPRREVVGILNAVFQSVRQQALGTSGEGAGRDAAEYESPARCIPPRAPSSLRPSNISYTHDPHAGAGRPCCCSNCAAQMRASPSVPMHRPTFCWCSCRTVAPPTATPTAVVPPHCWTCATRPLSCSMASTRACVPPRTTRSPFSGACECVTPQTAWASADRARQLPAAAPPAALSCCCAYCMWRGTVGHRVLPGHDCGWRWAAVSAI